MSTYKEPKLMVGYWYKNEEILENLKELFDDEYLEKWEGHHAYLAETFALNIGKEGASSLSFDEGENHFIGYHLDSNLSYVQHLNQVNKLSIKLMEEMKKDEQPLVSALIYTY